MYKDKQRKSSTLQKESGFIEDMKIKSDHIEQKLMENLEFLKLNSLEMTQMIKKKRKVEVSDSENSTMYENC